MKETAGIVWLASYPRSGNTWFRIVLEHVLAGDAGSADPRRPRIANAAGRDLIDRVLGIESGELTADEVDELRPRVYGRIARERDVWPLYLKTHDAWTVLEGGEALLAREATRAAIYLVRNPLDVAVSLTFHWGGDLDRAVERLCATDDALCAHPDRPHFQARQRVLGWSAHAESWTGPQGPPVHVVRYEDLLRDPEGEFASAFAFCGVDVERERLAEAIESSRFDRLRALEERSGFPERGRRAERFFRNGREGSWREHLSDHHIARIMSAHGPVMERFGYSAGDRPSSPQTSRRTSAIALLVRRDDEARREEPR